MWVMGGTGMRMIGEGVVSSTLALAVVVYSVWLRWVGVGEVGLDARLLGYCYRT